MKDFNTYNGYPSSEVFNLDGKVFSTIVIANGEARCFMKALLVYITNQHYDETKMRTRQQC